jgi:hypothetical protein
VNDFNQGGVIVTRDQRAEALEAKRRFWRQHIERWKRSGLKQSVYCRRHELKLHCFTYWRKKVRRAAQAPVSLVELRLPSVATTEAIVTTGHRPLRLMVSSNHCVELERDFDPVALRQLLKVLERP